MNVRSILRDKGAEVVTIAPDATLAAAIAAMDARNVGALAVSGDGRTLAGMIAERDVIRLLAADGAAALERAVGEIMAGDPATCTLDSPTVGLMALMTERRVRHIPVVENGVLAGIVSIGDLVKQRIAAAEHEVAAMRQYIAGA